MVWMMSPARLVFAQDQPPTCPCPPPPPEKGPWSVSAGVGFSLNRGNADTTNLNLTFDAKRDPKQADVWTFQALYLRGETNGEPTVDRLFLQGRYERNIGPRLFVFGQFPYLRDEFKQIDYLLAPSAGVGYKLVETPTTLIAVDGGAGVKVEKNPGLDAETSGMFTSGDRIEWKVTPTATITQSFSALWNADDFGDALYTARVGLAASIATRFELKIEVLDAYSTRPPNPAVKKNDVAFITALVFKI
jgi:putative salt-induced outer membrane protein YdiY